MRQPGIPEEIRGRANARRRMLRAALRSGDVRAAARAASRARLPRFGLQPDEAEHASAARRRFGRALRNARARRQAADPPPVLTVVPAARGRRRLRLAPAIAVAALVMLFMSDAAPVLPAAATSRLTPGCARALEAPLGERREDVLKAPPPEYYGPAFVAADGTSVAPIVDPYRAGPIAPGFARLIGRVIDDTTGAPVDDACLIYTYGLVRFRAPTDAAGIFVADIPAGTLTVDLHFEHVEHETVLVQLQPWGAGQVRFFLDARMPPR